MNGHIQGHMTGSAHQVEHLQVRISNKAAFCVPQKLASVNVPAPGCYIPRRLPSQRPHAGIGASHNQLAHNRVISRKSRNMECREPL